MSAIRGECRGNLRSTPSPATIRRTTNISRVLAPERAITTPLKIWIRSFSPSRIRTWTSTVSPISKCGTVCFMLDCSTSSRNAFCMAGSTLRGSGRFSTMVAPPAGDRGVVAAEQDVGDGVPPELPGAGVLRVFQAPVGAERLILRAGRIAQHAGDQPHHRVDDDHGRDLAPREDIVADGQQLGPQDVEDPLVEPLVPAAEQHQAPRPGQLPDPSLIEPTPLGRQGDEPPGPVS